MCLTYYYFLFRLSVSPVLYFSVFAYTFPDFGSVYGRLSYLQSMILTPPLSAELTMLA